MGYDRMRGWSSQEIGVNGGGKYGRDVFWIVISIRDGLYSEHMYFVRSHYCRPNDTTAKLGFWLRSLTLTLENSI